MSERAEALRQALTVFWLDDDDAARGVLVKVVKELGLTWEMSDALRTNVKMIRGNAGRMVSPSVPTDGGVMVAAANVIGTLLESAGIER